MGERGGVGCEARRGRDDVDSLNTGVSVSDCRADKSKSMGNMNGGYSCVSLLKTIAQGKYTCAV